MVKAAKIVEPDKLEDIQYAGLHHLKPFQEEVLKKKCVEVLLKARREVAKNVKMIVDVKVYGEEQEGKGKEEKYDIDIRLFVHKRNVVVAKEARYGFDTTLEWVMDKLMSEAKKLSSKRDDWKSKYMRDRKNYEESIRLVRKRPGQKLTFSKLVKR